MLEAEADCFDDFQYIDENPLVMNPGWESAQRFLREVSKPSTVTGYYQPLTMISLMLDVSAGASPLNERPFHATSLVLHVANTVLIGLILHAIVRNAWAAAAAALLFGLHPMTVEPIAWCSERKTLLSSFFALGSVLGFVAYGRRSEGGDLWNASLRSGRRWAFYGVSLIAYALALLAKPTATPLPAALLLLCFWPLSRLLLSDGKGALFSGPRSRIRWNVVVELAPFAFVGAISAVITFVSQRDAGGVATPGAGYDVGRIPLVLAYDLALYVRNIVFPNNLIPHNPFPDPLNLTDARVAVGLVLSLGGVSIVLWSLRRTRALFTGSSITFLLLLPTLQLVQFSYSVISDKYFYLPAFGLLLIVAWGLDRSCNRLRARLAGPTRAFLLLAVVVVVCAVAETAGTRRQLGYWMTTESLDRRLIALNPDNSEFHFDLGNALWDQGRLEEAHRELGLAVELDSTNVRALNNLALSAAYRDEGARAIGLWKQTLRHHPGNYVARCNLAFYDLERSGRIEEALTQYERALRDYSEEKQQGRRAQAVGRADPGAPSQVYAMLGHAHFLLGHSEQALQHLRQSIALPQPFPLAFIWLREALLEPLDGEDNGAATQSAASLREFQRLLEGSGPGAAFSALADWLREQGRHERARIASAIAADFSRDEE